jgi:hypothetical protein
MAVAAGCPITPFGAVGAEERFQVLVDTDQRAAAPVRALIRRVAGRSDVGTLLVRGQRAARRASPRPALLPFRRAHPDHAVGRPGK